MKKKPMTASEMGKKMHRNLKKRLGIKGYKEEQKRRLGERKKAINKDIMELSTVGER